MSSITEVMITACVDSARELIPCFGRSSYEAPVDLGVSKTLSLVGGDYVERSRLMRGHFAATEVTKVRTVSGHTHAQSAANRNSASAYAELLGAVSGTKVKFVQASGSDQAKGREGSRTWHWVKDMNATPTPLLMEDNDLAVLVDVDYHLDMPALLASHPANYLLYTMQPSRAARVTDEYKYTFVEGGNLRYIVSGGADYEHALWDWGGDSVSVSTKWCCFPRNYTGYAVERKNVDEDHQLVLLTPYKRFTFLGAWLAKSRLQSKELRRMDPVDGTFARILVNEQSGMKMSTARLGGFLAATVPVEVDEAIIMAAETSKDFTRSMAVSKMVGPGGDPSQASGSEVYVSYLQEKLKSVKSVTARSHMVNHVDHIRHMQHVLDYDLYEQGKPAMESFMAPFLDAAFVAERHYNNDVRTVAKRVKALEVPAKPITSFLLGEMKEFAQLLGAAVGKLHPVDYDEVYAKQSRPTQRRILELAENESDGGDASAMQKAEAYPNVNDPRNITIMNGPSKREHSKWMYPIYTALKTLPWYAFGKTPDLIADRIADLASECLLHWLDSDFSRQDGRVDETVRIFENIVMRVLFHPQYHAEIMKSLRAQTFLNVKTRFGVRYNSKWSRASGSAQTSVFNTMLTAFIFYLAFRMSRNPFTGAYYDAGEAWSKLGLYGGDDGGTGDAVPSRVEKAAVMMGQKVECSIIQRGTVGVQFLARRYGPDVWHGDSNSCCDIVRQLSKFHACTMLSGVTPERKLWEKAYAYSLSDAATPILGPYVTKVISMMTPETHAFENVHQVWNAQYKTECQYPNVYADWMTDIVTKELPGWNQTVFDTWLDGCNTTDDLRSPPPCIERPEAIPRAGLVVVDGEFLGEREKPKHPLEVRPKKHRTRKTNQYRGTTTGAAPTAPPTKRKTKQVYRPVKSQTTV